jgi:hypothetical protein
MEEADGRAAPHHEPGVRLNCVARERPARERCPRLANG